VVERHLKDDWRGEEGGGGHTASAFTNLIEQGGGVASRQKAGGGGGGDEVARHFNRSGKRVAVRKKVFAVADREGEGGDAQAVLPIPIWDGGLKGPCCAGIATRSTRSGK